MSLVSSPILKTRWGGGVVDHDDPCGTKMESYLTWSGTRCNLHGTQPRTRFTCQNMLNGYSGHRLNDLVSFAVATVVFSTSTLIAIRMIYIKHWSIIVAVAFFLFWSFIDGALH